jgi:hypothetical protein
VKQASQLSVVDLVRELSTGHATDPALDAAVLFRPTGSAAHTTARVGCVAAALYEGTLLPLGISKPALASELLWGERRFRKRGNEERHDMWVRDLIGRDKTI